MCSCKIVTWMGERRSSYSTMINHDQNNSQWSFPEKLRLINGGKYSFGQNSPIHYLPENSCFSSRFKVHGVKVNTCFRSSIVLVDWKLISDAF